MQSLDGVVAGAYLLKNAAQSATFSAGEYYLTHRAEIKENGVDWADFARTVGHDAVTGSINPLGGVGKAGKILRVADEAGDAGTAARKLPGTTFERLPAEAKKTLDDIHNGGPFRYKKDSTTFGNREGRLPQRPTGYYREYTVDTPGASDRGARRLVVGKNGETYYTDDHYGTFTRVE